MRYLHFITHGIHHMFPFDPYRLVLPPGFVALILLFGYLTLYQIFALKDTVDDFFLWTGFVTGYCIYDMTHYFIHNLEMTKHEEKGWAGPFL